MSIIPKYTLNDKFQNGNKPPEWDFWAWQDSYWHKLEPIPISAVENLENRLSKKADLVNGKVPKEQLPFTIETNEIVALGEITVTNSSVLLDVHPSGSNKVLLNGTLRERQYDSRFSYQPVSNGIKVLVLYALDDEYIFHLSEGVESAETIEPPLPTGALFIRRMIATIEGVTVDTQATTGYKTIAEDGWKNIIIGNNNPYYIIATQANGSFNIMSRSSAPTIAGITTKGGKYGWDGREFLFYNAAEIPVRLGPGAWPPDNPHAKTFIFREGLDYELKPHQYVRIKIIGDVLDVVTAVAADGGKVDTVMNVAPDANKNVDISGVNMHWTGQQRLSALQDKSADATFSRMRVQDGQGNEAYGNGAIFLKKMPSLLTEAEKITWRTEMNGGWTTGTMSVGAISPLIISSLYDGISYMVLYGANLNLNPANFKVLIVDKQGAVVKQIDNSKVQLNTAGLSLTFYENYKNIPEGDYKIKLYNGLAEYTTPMTFKVVSSEIDRINISAITWEKIGLNGKIHPDNIASGGALTYQHSSELPYVNTYNVIWGAKSSKIFEPTDNFYIRFSFSRSFNSVEGRFSSGTYFHIGLCDSNENLDLVNKVSAGVRVNDPFTYPNGGHSVEITSGRSELNIAGVTFSREIYVVKTGNMITIINGAYQGTVIINFQGGVSLCAFAENKIDAWEYQSVNIQEAYKF